MIARVRPEAAAGTKITSRATAYWTDTAPHNTLRSNSVTFTVGATADWGTTACCKACWPCPPMR